MMPLFTPVLAHDPVSMLSLIAGVFLIIALLHAVWYWFVHQVGFMLASIGTKVETWRKVAVPLALIPLSGMMTVFVPLLLALIMPEEGEAVSFVWMTAGILLLVGLLFVVPFLLGYYMLCFSLKRSMLTAFFQVLVYAMLVVPVGVNPQSASHAELSSEVTECRIAPEDDSAPETTSEEGVIETAE